jgi:hypothetical protein
MCVLNETKKSNSDEIILTLNLRYSGDCENMISWLLTPCNSIRNLLTLLQNLGRVLTNYAALNPTSSYFL